MWLFCLKAEPAESRSVVRRSKYREYQQNTNVLVPFNVPYIFDHHRTAGWPNSSAAPASDQAAAAAAAPSETKAFDERRNLVSMAVTSLLGWPGDGGAKNKSA